MWDLLYKPALELAFSLLLEMASPSGDGDGDDYHVKIVSKEVVVNALPLRTSPSSLQLGYAGSSCFCQRFLVL